MRKRLIAVVIFGSVSFGSVSWGVLAQTPADAEATLQQGAVVYATHCLACHQATGQGIEGAFPALAGSALVLGDAAEVVKLPLYGRGGMPNFGGELSDEEIAAVVSHIRNSWGNEAGVVGAKLVTKLRNGETEAAPPDPSARPGAAN